MTRRALAIVVVLVLATVRQAAAQPATVPASAPAPSEDEPLFRCRNLRGQSVLTLKVESDVKELITWVMSFTCKNFLLDPRVVSTGRKISMITPNKMTPAEAYQVFLAALATINLTVVPRGSVLRIVEVQQARQQALPLLKSGTPADVEQVVRYVYRPSYIAGDSLRVACQAMKSDAGDVFTVGPVVVITDYASHVREMLSFAKLVDVPGGSDGIYTLPVHHADATKLTDKLNAILNPSSGGAATPRPAAVPGAEPGKPETRHETSAVPSKIVVDDRTNTLIIASGEAGYQRVKALVERLDIPLEIEGGSAIHVYPLGSAVAEELAKTLTAAISDARAKPATGGPAPQPARVATPAGEPPVGDLGAALEGQVRVIADPPTNSLIVMSSGRDFLAIKDVIKQLDLPRREVYLEVMILEVEASDDTTLGTTSHGGQSLGKGTGVLFGGVKTPDVNTLTILDSLKNVTGLFGGAIGPSMSLLGQSIPSYAVLFQATASQSRANIISSPSIIAVDNVEAKYKVGQKIPVNKGTVLTPFGGSATAAPNIELTEFPLKLDIKPHISNDDMVLLEVKHDADQLQVESDRGPRSSTRSFETRVVVHDQETVVLGGLTQDKDTTSISKVPLLGDIPLLGYLFKTTVRSKLKSNLLIMLTPYIIKDRRDLQAIHERKLREHDEFARSMSALDHMKYEARIDYRKKRGLLEDINRAVLDVEQDIAARSAIARPRQVEAGSIDAPHQP